MLVGKSPVRFFFLSYQDNKPRLPLTDGRSKDTGSADNFIQKYDKESMKRTLSTFIEIILRPFNITLGVIVGPRATIPFKIKYASNLHALCTIHIHSAKSFLEFLSSRRFTSPKTNTRGKHKLA